MVIRRADAPPATLARRWVSPTNGMRFICNRWVFTGEPAKRPSFWEVNPPRLLNLGFKVAGPAERSRWNQPALFETP